MGRQKHLSRWMSKFIYTNFVIFKSIICFLNGDKYLFGFELDYHSKPYTKVFLKGYSVKIT